MQKKRNIPYGVFAVLLIILIIVFYLISGVFNVPDVSFLNIEECLIYSVLHPLDAWNDKTPACLAIALLVWGFFVAYYLQFYRNYHPNMFGSTEWRDVYEANKFYADEDEQYNRIITQNLKVSLRKGLSNNNMAVIASSGDFKTTGVVEQNLLQFISSYIVLDVKGELQRKWGNAFKKEGYKVQSLNFVEPQKSDRYNPFVYIENESDVLRVVRTLHEACRPSIKKQAAGDPFWDDAVKLLLQSLFEAVWLEARKKKRIGTMNRLTELLDMESQKVENEDTGEVKTRLQVYMDDLADHYGEKYPPVRDYRKLKDGAPDTVSSVFLMLHSMMAICGTAEVKRIFEDNDIDIRELGLGVGRNPKKKTVLFLELPPMGDEYNWIISMFYTQCFDILERTSDLEVKGPLPIRVEFWMDEFYTGPKPLDTVRLLGIVRGWNISMVLILQSLAQIETLYPDKEWETVTDNLSVILFMGSGPMVTTSQEFISKTLGTGTYDIQNDSAHLGSNSNSGFNWSQQGRNLLMPDEVKNIRPIEAIVFIKSSTPIIDVKAIPFDKPEYDYIAPKWLKERYHKYLNFGDYEHPVYTIYDAEHFHYITVKRNEPLQIFTDRNDISALQNAAKNDPYVYTFNVQEDELLYLSWGKKNEYTQAAIESAYNKILEDEKLRKEKMKGLIVLQDVENVPNFGTQQKLTDKTGWERCSTLKSLIAAHWDELSLPEQEEICMGMEEGLTEEQLRMLMLYSLSEMSMLRKAFVEENRQKGQEE